MQLMEHEAPGGQAEKAGPVLGSVISWKPDSLNESTRTGYQFEEKFFLERGASLESRAAHTHPKNTQVPPPRAFMGTAKPYCSICSSPYHQSDDCPHQEPSKKPRRTALVCFDFNKPSGCQRRTFHFPHNCHRCGSSSHALFNCPSSKQHATSTKSAAPGDRSKK